VTEDADDTEDADADALDVQLRNSALHTRALPMWRRYITDCCDLIDTNRKGVPIQL
jgi:hypothetical protein